MCKIIAICNQKGGVGKTTTTANTGVLLAEEGKKVLILDFDPQGNLSMGMGIDYPDDLEFTISELLLAEKEKPEIQEKYIKQYFGVDFIPSNTVLSDVETTLITAYNREKVLDRFLRILKNDYDYILIDCPPSLNILTVNALSASDEVIIPVQTQYYSTKGLELLLNTITKVKKQLNRKLKIRGILLTMLDRRSSFQKSVTTIVTAIFGELHVFNTIIPTSVLISELQSKGQPIVKSNSNASVGYRLFVKELLSNE